jgi:hypothetical protein
MDTTKPILAMDGWRRVRGILAMQLRVHAHDVIAAASAAEARDAPAHEATTFAELPDTAVE